MPSVAILKMTKVMSNFFVIILQFNVFSHVVSQLQNNASFSSTPNKFDLHEEFSSDKCQFIKNYDKNWHPIDTNLILPTHRTWYRFPATFHPCKREFIKKGNVFEIYISYLILINSMQMLTKKWRTKTKIKRRNLRKSLGKSIKYFSIYLLRASVAKFCVRTLNQK